MAVVGHPIASPRGVASNCRLFSFYRRLRMEPLEDRRLLSITVNSLVDEQDGNIVDGDVSLRDAIANAASGETINFSVTGTINLTGLGDLVINKNLTINGPGRVCSRSGPSIPARSRRRQTGL